MVKVTRVSAESVLKGRILPNDSIIEFNGNKFSDILDYVYADSAESGEVKLERNGEVFTLAYNKNNPFDTLGLEFDSSAEITPVECCNNCIFCFVKQLPKNLRETLYVKDDDYRLSFVSGSYITCTNLKEKDIQRIIDYRLSPLYISVHATDEEVRKYLLGVKRCPPQLPMLKRFIENGITIHSQIVLVPDLNDGDVLKKSLKDLWEIGVSTVAVVPVGLTGHRENLPVIKPMDSVKAREAIAITEEFYSEHEQFCICADEMYQIANLDVHEPVYYGNYDQIENGVGLIAKFLDELSYALEIAPKHSKKRNIGVITGISGESVMLKAKNMVENKYKKIRINVYPVVNKFFGESVTVTGLVTATDIIRCYGEKKFEEDYLMLPSVMLKEFGDVFLDDVSVSELSKKINKKIVVSHPDGEGFLKAVLRGEKKW